MAKSHDLSIAVWRYPHESSFSVILSFQELQNKNIDLENDQGFAVANFLSSNKHAFFIPNDVMIKAEKNELTIFAKKEYAEQLEDLLEKEVSHKRQQENKLISIEDDGDKDKNTFTKLVEEAVYTIKDGFFKKVVVARKKEVALANSFSIEQTLHKMQEDYPNAFISYVYSPELGSWLGASPEILLEIKDKQYFKTISLAGTQAANGQNPKEAVWTQKEIEEQALVTRYIIDCLKKIRLREYEDRGPRTVKAANLFHLQTDFEVDMEATNFPELGNVMLELLHPTSAVCGMPKEEALAFIKQHEQFDRKLYSGYLGPVNIENKTHLAVNLRCAEIHSDKAILYAGVGITEDSNPEKEWLETEMKLKTMGKVLAE